MGVDHTARWDIVLRASSSTSVQTERLCPKLKGRQHFHIGHPAEAGLEKITKFDIRLNFTPQGVVANSYVDAIGNNNVAHKTVSLPVAQVARPDLQIEVEDFSVINGGVTKINYKITNVGEVPIVNQVLDIDLWLKGIVWHSTRFNINNASLAPGQVLAGSFDWLPSSPDVNLVVFNGSLDALIDLSGALETNINNNKLPRKVPFVTVPDLIPEHLNSVLRTIPDDNLLKPGLLAGATVTTRWEVSNKIAPATAQVRQDAFYWSKDTTYDLDDILAARVTQTVPKQSNSRTVTEADVVLPTAGDWYLLFRVDDTNSITETNEINNVRSSPKLQIASNAVDLAIGTVTTASTAIAGEPLQVSWNALNIGDVAFSGSRTERVVLRKAGQQFTYDFSYSDLLSPGASVARTQSITPPVTLSGSWEVSVIVDPENAIAESKGENNNEAPVPAQVNIAAGRNLVVSQLRVPSLVWANQVAQVEWRVTNTGADVATQGWTDRIYLSSDANFGNDILLGSLYDLRQLAAGAEYAASAFVRLPDNVAQNFHILVVTDASGMVPEAAETDNVIASPLLQIVPLGLDLAIGAVTAGASAIAGEPLEVSWNARNIGVVAFSGARTERVVLRKEGQQFTYDFTYDDLLQPGESAARTQSILLPATISGSWDVVAP
jgi:subtilase family serine protease